MTPSEVQRDQFAQGDENPTRRLDKRSWLALGLVAALIVLHQFLIQPGFIGLSTDAPVINTAGRQRMLSQKLVKSALAMVGAKDTATRQHARSELSSTLKLWRESHVQLQSRPPSLVFGRPDGDRIQQGFLRIEPHFQAMIDAAETLLADSAVEVSPVMPEPSRIAVESLMSREAEFLTGMHALVEQYESEARRHVGQLQLWGFLIMAVILWVQLLMQLRVVRPELNVVGDEWKKIDDRYRLLVESMTDGLVVFDSSGRMEFANRRFCDLLNYERRVLIGQTPSTVIAAEDHLRFEQLFADANEIDGPIDLRWLTADHQLVETMISPRRLTDKRGTFERLLLVVTDMTARNAIDRRNQQLQSELAHADRLRSMGTMAAMIAHEINQPLCAIGNYAEGCLVRLKMPETVPQDLIGPIQGILMASQRGAEVIRRTREYSRRTDDRVSVVSVDRLVGEVEELCRAEARRRFVTIETRIAQGLPQITVDAIQIQQVLTNLIQNAFDAFERAKTPRRQIVLTVSRSPDDELEFAVADSGPGLPAGDSQSWFEPFVTTNQEGTGLGLAIAKGIVESHEGRIWAETNPDPLDANGGSPESRGAVFRFVLPLDFSSLHKGVRPARSVEVVHVS